MKLYLLILLSFLSIKLSYGQLVLDEKIKVITTGSASMSNNIDEIFNNTKINLTCINITNTTLLSKFYVILKKDGVEVLRTNENYAQINLLTFNPLESKMIDFTSLNVLKESYLDINPVAEMILGVTRRDLIRTGKLPEGNYDICIQFFDYTGLKTEVWNNPNVGCVRLNLMSYESPQIIDVDGGKCNATIKPKEIQFVVINWLRPAGFSNIIDYTIEIVEVLQANKEYNDAIFSSSRPFFLEETTQANTFIIDMTAQQMQPGARYVFRVKATDPDGNASFRNNGYSQVCSFIYGTQEDIITPTNMSVSLDYPNMNDTIPFRNIPVYSKFGPYNSSISEINTTLTWKENGVPIDIETKNLICAGGPKLKIEEINEGFNISEDVSKQMVFGKYDDNAFIPFERGKEYSLILTSNFKFSNTPIEQTIESFQTFNTGFPTPLIRDLPDNTDTGKVDFNIGFNFNPRFPFLGYNELDKIQQVYGFDPVLIVDERLMFELSNTNTFDSVWYRSSKPIKKTFDTKNPAVFAMLQNLYTDVSFPITIKESGTWYARVKLLRDPTDSSNNSIFYKKSGVKQFIISDGIDRSSSNCLAVTVNAPPVPGNEKTAIDSIQVGQKLTIGVHQMEIVSRTKTGNTFTGKGIIKINPFPSMTGTDIPIAVDFTNIKVNSSLRIFEGGVKSIDGSGYFSNKNFNQASAFVMDTASPLNTIMQSAIIYNANIMGLNELGMQLPLILKDNKNTNQIGLLNIDFSLERAMFNAVVIIKEPSLGINMSFIANQVPLGKDGLSVANLKLQLIKDKSFALGEEITLYLNGSSDAANPKTSVSWDCNGFKNLHLDGYIKLNPNSVKYETVVSYDSKTKKMIYSSDAAPVQAAFIKDIQGFKDMLLDVSFPKAFELKSLPRWTFKAQNIVLDCSETKNTASMIFPSNYGGEKSISWKGIYFKNITVKTPHNFKKRSQDSARLTFNIPYMMVDRTGFSGHISASNVLSINEGKFNDWAFGINSIDIKLISNSFEYGKINGELKLPIDKDKRLSYQMLIDFSPPENSNFENSYSLKITTLGQLDMPMWKSKLSVLPNSYASLYFNDNDSSCAEMVLNATLSIEATLPKVKNVNLNAITMQNFIVRSSNSRSKDSLDIKLGTFSFASPAKSIGGFPITIKNIGPTRKTIVENGNSVSLIGLKIDFDASINMGSNSLQCGTSLSVFANKSKTDGIFGFEYHSVHVDSLGIKGRISVVSVEGKLLFYDNDPIYGDGLMGALMAEFTPGVSLGAQAYFGSKTNGSKTYDYWGIFGSVVLPQGIPILAAFEINGFGGGVYKNMQMQLSNGNNIMSRNVVLTGADLIPKLVPNEGVFGFRATIFAQSFPGGTSWKAGLSLGAELNSVDFAVNNINMQGNLWMIPPTSKNPNEVPKANMWASAIIKYDFKMNQLDGNFDFYLNHDASNTKMNGIGLNDLAGQIILHYSPSKWFVYAGKPDVRSRCGIRINSPSIQLDAYFVMGTEIPGIPDMPAKITQFLNQPVNDQRSAEISNGAGLGFGASLSVTTGPQKFLFLKASLDLLVGFDLSLMKYGNASCDGISINKNLGLDGWYARGQIYAYIEGKISAHIDIGFIDDDFVIMDCKMAAALEGGLPNPFWASGAVAGQINLLGGMVKGPFKYKFTVGTVCKPSLLQDNPVEKMPIVAEVLPVNNTTGYNIFDSPAILTNFKIGQNIDIEVLDNNNNKRIRTFRPKLLIQLKKNNIIVVHNANYSSANGGDKISIALNGNNPFDANTKYTLSITEYFEEKINNNWAIAKNKSNVNISSTRNDIFTTGGIPITIPESIIAGMTPIIRENYFMKKEYSESGNILTKQFRADFSHNIRNMYFMDSVPHYSLKTMMSSNKNVGVDYVVRFTNMTNPSEVISQKINISSGNSNTYIFSNNDLANLTKETTYKVEFVRVKRLGLEGFNMKPGFYANTIKNIKYSSDIELNIKTNSFSSNFIVQEDPKEFVMFATYFHTSRYNEIKEKVLDVRNTLILANGSVLSTSTSCKEPFDEHELKNYVELIDVIQGNNGWYKSIDSFNQCFNLINNYGSINFKVQSMNVNMNFPQYATYNIKDKSNFSQVWDRDIRASNYWKFEIIGGAMNLESNNNSFINKNFTRTGQSFKSTLGGSFNIDRTMMDNEIIRFMSWPQSLYVANINIFNYIPSNQLMPMAQKQYLTKFLNGSNVARSIDKTSRYKLIWSYYKKYYLTEDFIKFYNVNTLIDQPY